MTSTLPTPAEIAALIDHALLAPNMTEAQLSAGLALAAECGVFSVCVQPANVAPAVAQLAGTGVKVGTVIGFPHGATTTAIKVAETREALRAGAAEVDMVLNIGQLISGAETDVRRDISKVVKAAKQVRPDAIVKVILETAYLTDEQVAAGARLAQAAGADFVKTSTGFANGGATEKHLKIMAANVQPPTQLKASGGVRDLDTLLSMRELGVTRFGTSATAVILDDLTARRSGVKAPITQHTAAY